MSQMKITFIYQTKISYKINKLTNNIRSVSSHCG